jgi:hypothetical protein
LRTGPSIFDQPAEVDWLLAWIVSIAERGVEMSITLSVGGQLIAGTVIGGRKYFEEMGALLKTAKVAGGEEAQEFINSMSEGLSRWGDIYPLPADIPDNEIAKPT